MRSLMLGVGLLAVAPAVADVRVVSVEVDRYGSRWTFDGPVVAWGDVVDEPNLQIFEALTGRWLTQTRIYQAGEQAIWATTSDTCFNGAAWRILDPPVGVWGRDERIAWPQAGTTVPLPEQETAGMAMPLWMLARRRRRRSLPCL